MVERVAVIFFNADNVPLEKFVFKLAMNLSYGSAVEEVDLQVSLRSFMSKLSISESLTKKLPPGKDSIARLLQIIWEKNVLVVLIVLV